MLKKEVKTKDVTSVNNISVPIYNISLSKHEAALLYLILGRTTPSSLSVLWRSLDEEFVGFVDPCGEIGDLKSAVIHLEEAIAYLDGLNLSRDIR